MQNSEKRYKKKRNITEIKTEAEEYRGGGTNTVENTVKSFEDRNEISIEKKPFLNKS